MVASLRREHAEQIGLPFDVLRRREKGADHGERFCLLRWFGHSPEVGGTMTRDLLAMADWMAAQGVTHVAMESTGVYWKPIYNILESRFTVLLVNARHLKQVPGRKSDVRDCQWIAQLLQHGLLKGSLVPPRAQRE